MRIFVALNNISNIVFWTPENDIIHNHSWLLYKYKTVTLLKSIHQQQYALLTTNEQAIKLDN